MREEKIDSEEGDDACARVVRGRRGSDGRARCVSKVDGPADYPFGISLARPRAVSGTGPNGFPGALFLFSISFSFLFWFFELFHRICKFDSIHFKQNPKYLKFSKQCFKPIRYLVFKIKWDFE
jgi:hypothetical protein